MNTIVGFTEVSLEKELELARARVTLLESELKAVSGSEPEKSGCLSCWSGLDHYVRLVENIDQGVLVFDRGFEIVFINNRALELVGRERSAFDVQGLFGALGEDDRQRIREIVLLQRHAGTVERCECEFNLPSGDSAVLELKFTPLFCCENVYDGVQVIITDVTEDRRVRQALESSEKMYRALFEGAGDAIFVHDIDGNFIDANKYACERLGYSRDELVQMSPADIRVDRTSDSDQGPTFEVKSKLFEAVRHRARHGEILDVEVNSRIVDINGGKKILTIARDISERVEASRRAILNRERLKALYEMAHMSETSTSAYFEFAIRKGIELSQSEAGFITQLDGHGSEQTFHNWTAMDRFGTSGVLEKPDNLSECGSWRDVVVQRIPYYDNSVDAGCNLLPFAEGCVQSYLVLPILEAGRVIAVAAMINRKGGYEDDNVRNLGLLLDGMWNIICKKKSEQQVRQSLREKETLLKEVHHRVKNNMQVICSLLNLQTDYIKDPQDLKLIRNSIDRVRSMAYVHEQLYRSDDLSSINFEQYISGLGLKLISSYGVADKIHFSTRLERIKLPIEQALPCGLIVNELITNAISHAFPHSGEDKQNTISVELMLEANRVFMTVADNGVGFDGTPERSGSLGHILIDTLVQQIDGSLVSRSDKGARFELSFMLR